MLIKLNFRSLLFIGALSTLVATSTQAQTLLGSELRLNSQKGVVFDFDVTLGLDGVFTTVWDQAMAPYQGPQQGVARRFSSGGVLAREVRMVGASIPYHVIELPRVAPASGGGVIHLHSQSLPNGYEEIFGSRFSNQGSRLGSRFQVSPGPKSTAQVHAVAQLPSDGYFVLSEDYPCPSFQRPTARAWPASSLRTERPARPIFWLTRKPLAPVFAERRASAQILWAMSWLYGRHNLLSSSPSKPRSSPNASRRPDSAWLIHSSSPSLAQQLSFLPRSPSIRPNMATSWSSGSTNQTPTLPEACMHVTSRRTPSLWGRNSS